MIPKIYLDYYGDQTRWFTGEIVDINDPLELARVKVRVYGIHPDEAVVSNNDLPWAQVVVPVTHGGESGFGNNLGIQVGALVFGFFLDGQHSQLPLVLGSLPKYEADGTPSTNQLARGTQTKSYTPDSKNGEPADPYAAEYPHNYVYETPGGHSKEYDDTEGAERIRERHKSGTFYQINPDGELITHVVTDRYTLVARNDQVHVTGNVNLYVDGTTTITCSQVNMTGNLRVDGDVSVGGDVVTDAGISHNNHTHLDNPGLAGAITSPPK